MNATSTAARARDKLLGAARGATMTRFAASWSPTETSCTHCYRMLGSVHDADDALQDALLRAWRGLEKFEQRSSLRSWL